MTTRRAKTDNKKGKDKGKDKDEGKGDSGFLPRSTTLRVRE